MEKHYLKVKNILSSTLLLFLSFFPVFCQPSPLQLRWGGHLPAPYLQCQRPRMSDRYGILYIM